MYRKYTKRILDIVVSLLLMPLVMIFYIIVGIFIKVEDGGKVIYRGKRVGRNKKQFSMFKFRSMKENCDDIRNADGSTYNSDDDCRLTRTGKIIRKLSIDELPQIINILIGDMSFIGPRPSPCGNDRFYSDEYLKKFSIRPGLTGYNQAYFRNSADSSRRQKNDLYYVDNMSFSLDIRIFFKTISTVIGRQGIYTNLDNIT